MLTKIAQSHLFPIAFLGAGLFVPTLSPSIAGPEIRHQQRSHISGALENNAGLLRLNLTNSSESEFRGTARIGIGDDSTQKDLGIVEISLQPQETVFWKLSTLLPSGSHYRLAIHDLKGTIVFFKISPLRVISDSTPARDATVLPVNSAGRGTNSTNPSPAPVVKNQPSETIGIEVQVEPRLLAGENGPESPLIAFELSALRPVYQAQMNVSLKDFKETKTVSLNLQTTISFRLPPIAAEDRVIYHLTDRNGRTLARGELAIEELMDQDTLTVLDLRPDRESYEPGEQVKVTLLLEGKSVGGYKVEITIRDDSGAVLFRDQRQSGAADPTLSHEFSFNLPAEIKPPIIIEYKLVNTGSGAILDSGERELKTGNGP